MEFIRDYAMYASVFGIFSFVWFGWAQEKPPKPWRKFLGLAAGVALLVCLFGVYLSVMNWNAPSALTDPSALRQYLFSVYIEIALAGAGAFILIKSNRSAFVPLWIVFIVGVHFIGLKAVFDDPALYLLAALLVAVSLLSFFVARRLQVAISAITGIGAGTVLLGFAVLGLVRFYLA